MSGRFDSKSSECEVQSISAGGPREASGVSQSLRLKLPETDVLQYTVTCYVVTRFKEKKNLVVRGVFARLGSEQRRNRSI